MSDDRLPNPDQPRKNPEGDDPEGAGQSPHRPAPESAGSGADAYRYSPGGQTQGRSEQPAAQAEGEGRWSAAWQAAPPQVPGRPAPSGAGPAGGGEGPRGSSHPGWLALLVAMLVTALVSVGGAWALGGGRGTASASTSTSTSTPSPTSTASSVPTVASSSGDAPDWQAVAHAVRPATVTIQVASGNSQATGSGAIYDTAGHIVTNNHVVSSASNGGQIQVTLSDGRLYRADMVGTDSTTDLAVIKLQNPPADLKAAQFGSSSDLQVGQPVMAIGSPLGLSDTATTGIISALNRPVEVSGEQQSDPTDPFNQFDQGQTQQGQSVVTNAIQVDASINPGNSGGPLFDDSGRVIGINSSIASLSSSSSSESGSIGLGFAIPSNLVTSIVKQLIANGKASHAVLGVTVTTGDATVNGATRAGAQIVSVSSGSGAAAAGLREGDVILQVDGNAVNSAQSVTGYIRTFRANDTVTLQIVRGGQVSDVKVTLKGQS